MKLTSTTALLVAALIALHGCSDSSTPDRLPTDLTVPRIGETIAFTGVNVIPMTAANAIIENQTVVIQNGTITAVGNSANVAVPAGATVINAASKYMIPGLHDMHAHFLRREELLMYLANGVTTIRNMAGYSWQIDLRDSIRAKQLPRIKNFPVRGPNIYTTGPVMQVGGHPAFGGPSIDSPTAARNSLASQVAAKVDEVKVYTLLNEATYRTILDEARKANLKVGGHTPLGVGLIKLLQGYPEGRQTSVEHFDGYLPNGTFDATEQVLEDLTVQNNIWNCFTLNIRVNQAKLNALKTNEPPGVSYMCSGRANGWRNEQQINHNIAEYQQLIKRLYDRGAKLMIGSDPYATYAVPGFALHRELEYTVAAGLTTYQALTLAIKTPAEYLNTSATSGTLEIGKAGNVVLLDANPLTDIRNTQTVQGVLVNNVYYSRQVLDQMLAVAACPN
ncbi:MAG: amidohydrolase family protein [Cyclobacteriaceae bacterium]|jgi:putative transposon-encoded protein